MKQVFNRKIITYQTEAMQKGPAGRKSKCAYWEPHGWRSLGLQTLLPPVMFALHEMVRFGSLIKRSFFQLIVN